jgi:hypothetical protein
LDSLRFMQALQRVEHRHGDEWHRMEPAPGHDAAATDRERAWARGRIFRCTSCDDEITVYPPDVQADPSTSL